MTTYLARTVRTGQERISVSTILCLTAVWSMALKPRISEVINEVYYSLQGSPLRVCQTSESHVYLSRTTMTATKCLEVDRLASGCGRQTVNT